MAIVLQNDSGHLSCWLICDQNIRLPLKGARDHTLSRKIVYEINQGFTCRSGLGRHSSDDSRARSDGPNNGSQRSSDCRACASAKGPTESDSAAYSEPIKCPNRGVSKRPDSATVSTGFNARERRLGAE